MALVHGRSEGSSVGNGEKRSFVEEKLPVSALNSDFLIHYHINFTLKSGLTEIVASSKFSEGNNIKEIEYIIFY